MIHYIIIILEMIHFWGTPQVTVFSLEKHIGYRWKEWPRDETWYIQFAFSFFTRYRPLDFTRTVPFPLNIFLFGREMESIWTNTRKRRSETGRWKNRLTNIPMFFMICWPTYPVGSACLVRKIVYVRSIFRLVFFLLPLLMLVDENIHRVRIFKGIF